MEAPLGANVSIPAEARPAALRLYSQWQVFVAAFIGSTLAGGVLLAINFKRLGQSRRAAAALGLGALALVVLFAVGAVADANNPGRSRTSLPLASAFACYGIARGVQGQPYKLNVGNGGGRESWWKAIGWAVAGMLLVLVVVVALVMLGVSI